MKTENGELTGIEMLMEIMQTLRDPDKGCPWDKQQSNKTIAPYTIEEAYEVAEAIAENDNVALKDELGDLLFQIVFYSQIASEKGHFTFRDVVDGISRKMIRRHPHVFGDRPQKFEDNTESWEQQKKKEREERARARGIKAGTLSNVPIALPALARALKLQKRAASVGFDWTNVDGALMKLEEETGEFLKEIASTSDTANSDSRISEELGDILFSWVNIARFYKIDPEAALRSSNAKFIHRFQFIESVLRAENLNPETVTLEKMEMLWNQAKAEEKKV